MTPFDPPETVKAKDFAPGAAPAKLNDHGDTRKKLLLIVVTTVLGLFAAAVVFVLPRWVERPDAEQTAVVEEHGRQPVKDATAPLPEPSGPDNPEAREQTQALLREVLESLESLEARGADLWAKSDMHTLRTRIAEGEKAYREKRYQTAQNIYLESKDDIGRLLAETPEIVAGLLDAGQLALANGISAEATEAFQQVLKIEADHEAAQAGLKRALTLDQVLALVGQAEGYESLGQPRKALDAYRDAMELDPQAPGAASAIARIEAGKREDRYRDAMGAGFTALANNAFDDARKHFKRAGKLDATQSAVGDALQQVGNAEASYFIDKHLADGRQAQAAENWDKAHRAFSRALKFDKRLSPAIAGRAEAASRRRLDAQLLAYLAKPERLTSDAVHSEASRVLANAEGLKADGARIRGQISTLKKVLRLAKTPIDITLRSDGATDVTIYRIGGLGSFGERRLSVLPGQYTAIGKRDGYRDVRVEFSVNHDSAPQPLIIQCQEKFAFGN